MNILLPKNTLKRVMQDCTGEVFVFILCNHNVKLAGHFSTFGRIIFDEQLLFPALFNELFAP